MLYLCPPGMFASKRSVLTNLEIRAQTVTGTQSARATWESQVTLKESLFPITSSSFNEDLFRVISFPSLDPTFTSGGLSFTSSSPSVVSFDPRFWSLQIDSSFMKTESSLTNLYTASSFTSLEKYSSFSMMAMESSFTHLESILKSLDADSSLTICLDTKSSFLPPELSSLPAFASLSVIWDY